MAAQTIPAHRQGRLQQSTEHSPLLARMKAQTHRCKLEMNNHATGEGALPNTTGAATAAAAGTDLCRMVWLYNSHACRPPPNLPVLFSTSGPGECMQSTAVDKHLALLGCCNCTHTQHDGGHVAAY